MEVEHGLATHCGLAWGKRLWNKKNEEGSRVCGSVRWPGKSVEKSAEDSGMKWTTHDTVISQDIRNMNSQKHGRTMIKRG